MDAPLAPRRPYNVLVGRVDGEFRGEMLMDPPCIVTDDLFWLRDDARENGEILDLLRRENSYTSSYSASWSGSADILFAELRSRLKETDTELPYRESLWWRYTRTVEDLAFPIHCRAPAAMNGSAVDLLANIQSASRDGKTVKGEEVLLDENEVADLHKRDIDTGESESVDKHSDDDDDISGTESAKHGTCDVGGLEVSPDGGLLCFSLDTSGKEVYTLCFRNLNLLANQPHTSYTETLLEDELKGCCGSSFSWGALTGPRSSPTSLFYLTLNSLQRPYRLWCHKMGSPQSDDLLLFEEHDEKFWLSLERSASGGYLFVESSSKLTSEVRVIPLTEEAEAACISANAERISPSHPYSLVIDPRREGVLYSIDHYENYFVIHTNAGAPNFKVCVTRTTCPQSSNWKEILPHSPQRYITSLTTRANFWAICGREDGFQRIWVAPTYAVDAVLASSPMGCIGKKEGEGPPSDGELFLPIPPRQSVFFMEDLHHQNLEWGAKAFRFIYSSFTTPTLTCEWRPKKKLDNPSSRGAPTWGTGVDGALLDEELTVLKRKIVPNVDLSEYATARCMALAEDGKLIPISLLFRPSAHNSREDAPQSDQAPFLKPAPLFLYGYGSYGVSEEPSFSTSPLSLADRGVVYAIAHVRGGGEMGRNWYDPQGKLLCKKNTFSDFIACAHHLVSKGWTSPGLMVAEGGSAGGLLMGVVANTAPHLWAGVLMGVPFCDIVVTMCDPSIPLVNTEWDEWGNPNQAEAFRYISSYDPMRNIVKGGDYPHMLITTGLHDSRVGYWEPLKFCQRLRNLSSGKRSILFKCEMDEGHTEAMDRKFSIHEPFYFRSPTTTHAHSRPYYPSIPPHYQDSRALRTELLN